MQCKWIAIAFNFLPQPPPNPLPAIRHSKKPHQQVRSRTAKLHPASTFSHARHRFLFLAAVPRSSLPLLPLLLVLLLLLS